MDFNFIQSIDLELIPPIALFHKHDEHSHGLGVYDYLSEGFPLFLIDTVQLPPHLPQTAQLGMTVRVANSAEWVFRRHSDLAIYQVVGTICLGNPHFQVLLYNRAGAAVYLGAGMLIGYAELRVCIYLLYVQFVFF